MDGNRVPDSVRQAVHTTESERSGCRGGLPGGRAAVQPRRAGRQGKFRGGGAAAEAYRWVHVEQRGRSFPRRTEEEITVPAADICWEPLFPLSRFLIFKLGRAAAPGTQGRWADYMTWDRKSPWNPA